MYEDGKGDVSAGAAALAGDADVPEDSKRALRSRALWGMSAALLASHRWCQERRAALNRLPGLETCCRMSDLTT